MPFVIILVCILSLLMGCTTQSDVSTFRFSSFSLDTILPKFDDIVNPNAPLSLKEEVRLYAPFCNWKNDTIILEKEVSIPGFSTIYIAQTPSRDEFCVSYVEMPRRLDSQKIFSSIYDYVAPSDCVAHIENTSIEEAIAVQKEFRYWDTVSIERRLKEVEVYSETPLFELRRIIIANGKIVNVDTYRRDAYIAGRLRGISVYKGSLDDKCSQ